VKSSSVYDDSSLTGIPIYTKFAELPMCESNLWPDIPEKFSSVFTLKPPASSNSLKEEKLEWLFR